jgi:hypothetical protein
MTESIQYEQGYDAYFIRGETENPFCEDTQEEKYDEWQKGNEKAQADQY